jgi:hypothetical protein
VDAANSVKPQILVANFADFAHLVLNTIMPYAEIN